MKNEKTLKFIGIATTLLGAALSVVSSWLEEQQLDRKVEEKVNQALASKTASTEE